MADKTIFAYGVFVSLLLLGGLIYNILEFRKMGEDPEKYSHR